MIAQLISQISSHVIIFYHRRIVTRGVDRFKQNSLDSNTSQDPALAEAQARPQYQDQPQYHVRSEYQDSEDLDNKVKSHLTDSGQEQSHSSSSLEDVTVDQNNNMSLRDFFSVRKAKTAKESLSAYQFSRPHRGETEKLVIRSYVNKLLPLCALSLFVCVVVGCILPSFSLEFFGLVGVAVEFGQDFEEATVDH